MSNSIFYVQECPTCGRSLQIRVEYLGRRMVCEHCRGRFTARDPACSTLGVHDDLLQRADALLQSLEAELSHRAPTPR